MKSLRQIRETVERDSYDVRHKKTGKKIGFVNNHNSYASKADWTWVHPHSQSSFGGFKSAATAIHALHKHHDAYKKRMIAHLKEL